MTEHPVTGIDHAYLLVDDLDAAAQAWARMGFTLSPLGLHSAAMGTANHTMMFPHDYLELLGVVSQVEGSAANSRTLAEQGQGLHAIALAIDGTDAPEAARALAAREIRTGPVQAFSRPVNLPGGGRGEAAFSIFGIEADAVPQGRVFACAHHTRDMVWLPELLEHPNGATGLHSITILAADPEVAAQRYARLFAAGAVGAGEFDGVLRVDTGPRSAALRVLAPEAAGNIWPGLDLADLPHGAFAGVAVTVRDLHAAEALMRKAALDPVALPGPSVAIGPADAAGAVVEFVEG